MLLRPVAGIYGKRDWVKHEVNLLLLDSLRSFRAGTLEPLRRPSLASALLLRPVGLGVGGGDDKYCDDELSSPNNSGEPSILY